MAGVLQLCQIYDKQITHMHPKVEVTLPIPIQIPRKTASKAEPISVGVTRKQSLYEKEGYTKDAQSRAACTD